MDGLKIEDKLRDLEEFIGKSFVSRIDCISANIANDFNYRSSYAADISDVEAAKIGLTSNWHHLFYNKHSNVNGHGIEIAFPFDTNLTPKYRNAINGVWQDWKNINDGGNADKLDGYHASNFLLKSGGTITGALNFANGTWNLMGDDAYIGDCNAVGCIGIKGNNGNTGIYFTPYSGSVAQTITINGAGTMTISGTVAGSFSGTLNSLNTYQMETLAANGGRHGTSHYLYCRHNTFGDGRFGLLTSEGIETRVHCASHLQGYYPRNVYQDAAYIPLTGNMPLEIGQWIDFHCAGSGADFNGRLYYDSTNGGLCWNDTINSNYNMNITWEIHNLKQQAINGISNKQKVVDAIDGKLGYKSGLTTEHSGADYAWWINNKINTGYNVTFNSWNQLTNGSTTILNNITGYAMTQFSLDGTWYNTYVDVVLIPVAGTVYYMAGGGLMLLTQNQICRCDPGSKFEVYCEPGGVFSASLSNPYIWVTQYMRYN